MRAVVQRVLEAQVTVDGNIVSQIGPGFLVLLGVGQEDEQSDARYLAEKIAYLRVFPDESGKMNRNILDAGGAVLVVSQFTLYGDCRRGRRPSFSEAASPELSEKLYGEFVSLLRHTGVPVQTGVFQADMQVSLVNDGPVTILLSSQGEF